MKTLMVKIVNKKGLNRSYFDNIGWEFPVATADFQDRTLTIHTPSEIVLGFDDVEMELLEVKE